MADFSKEKALLRQLGNEGQAMTAIDVARGAAAGRPAPELENLPAEQLGVLDRLAWGAQTREQYGPALAFLSGLGTAVPYEGLKWAAQSDVPGVNVLMHGAGKVMGLPPDWTALTKTTSPASWKNVLAYLEGAAGGTKPLPDEYRERR